MSARKRSKLAVMGGLTAGATVAMAGAAQAATTYTVGTTDDTSAAADCAADNTDCSLRQAITLANGDTAFDTIEFHTGLTGTVLLGSGLPTITAPLAIDGPGANAITISGDDAYRIFHINQTSNGAGTTIDRLTLTHGRTPGADLNAIFPTNAGGAILNENGSLTVSHSVLTGNTAGGYGGAIESGGASGAGQSAYLYLSDSTVSGNSVDADGWGGGGVYLNYGGAAIDKITVSGNHAPYAGGGIVLSTMNSHVSISNSTIAGNSEAMVDVEVGGTFGGGGGLYSLKNEHGIALMNSTVAGNSAARGGGIFSEGRGGGSELPWTIDNTIVATNSAATDPDLGIDPGSDGSFDTSFDLIKSPGAAPITETVAGSNVIGVDPKLGPLAENGALNGTQTMAPECESPAIDKGNSPFFLTDDQRGFTRPVDLGDYPNSTAVDADGSDIGAVELETTPLTTCTPPPPPGGVTPAGPTGQRASALKRCKKKKSAQARKKCKKKANRLPV